MPNKPELKISKKWLEFAIEDAKTVHSLRQYSPTLTRTICFHAQQYVEKLLKGILDAKKKRIPKIHDLKVLARLCETENVWLPLKEDDLLFLSSVYIDMRYPPDVGLLPGGEPTTADAELAENIVEKLEKTHGERLRGNGKRKSSDE